MLATYWTLRRTKNYSVVLSISLVVWGLSWAPPGLQVREILPRNPGEVGQDQSRVVGEDTGPSLAHTSQIFDIYANKEILHCFGLISVSLGALIEFPLVAGA